MLASLARLLFEHTFLKGWHGIGIKIIYWDGRKTAADTAPHFVTFHIKSPSVLWGMLRHPSLGFGHAYTDGRLEVKGDLQKFLQDTYRQPRHPAIARLARWVNALPRRTSPARAKANARFHYDSGNDFFSKWLDPSLTYSCAYFRTEDDDLGQAQQQKRELVCRKLELSPGQTLLDVGCGWGSLLFHAMENYGVRGVGVTPSRQQASYIKFEARRRGLTDRLTIHVTDWRSITGSFDRVVSVGMYEHVGQAHGREFHRKWRSWLKPGGVSLLHTIGSLRKQSPDPWIRENIFPGGYIPTLAELASHAAESGLIIADVENLWRHYILTLQAWSQNFKHTRDEITALTNEQFTRTWWLYLNGSEAAFQAGRLVLWQLVLTPNKRMNQPLTRDAWSLAGHTDQVDTHAVETLKEPALSPH